MKTINLLGTAILAATLSMSAISCTNDENDPIVLDDTIMPTVVDDVLAKSSESLDKAEKAVAPAVITPESTSSIKKIVIGDGMKAYIYPIGTKAINSDVIVCEYTIEDGNIVIKGGDTFGDITITSVENAVEIAFQGMNYKGEKKETTAPKSTNEINICRAWSNAKYSAGIYVDKLPVYGAKEDEKKETDNIVDLKNAIMKKLETKEGFINDGFKFLNNNITGVNFLTNGTVLISYDNGTVEESDWKWVDEANGKLTTTIDGKEVDVDVRCETAKNGKSNTVYFVIDANLEGVGNLGVHKLSGRLICKMTDK